MPSQDQNELLQPLGQGRVALLRSLPHPTPALGEERSCVFLPNPFQSPYQLLQMLVLLAAHKLSGSFLKKQATDSWAMAPEILTWDVWGRAQESTFIAETDDLNTND